jgi:hypothetical protein
MPPRALVALALAGFFVALAISLAKDTGDERAEPIGASLANAPALVPPAELGGEQAAAGDIGAVPEKAKTEVRPAPTPPAPPPPATTAAARRGVKAYRGMGAWVDQYDAVIYDNPFPALEEMRGKGVRTVYLETGSWRLPRSRDFRDRLGTKLVIDQAHKLGMKVVAWYLPGLDDVRLDLRRTRAALRLRSYRGRRFDGFAVDIESQRVGSLGARNAALMRYSRALRRRVGSRYALGAIVPDQRSSTISPGLWPRLPYRSLARLYDVFLPMAYSTFRGHGAGFVYRYTRANVEFVRRATRRPVHIIGGLDPYLLPSEPAAVVRGARDGGAIGASFYDFVGAQDATWGALRGG